MTQRPDLGHCERQELLEVYVKAREHTKAVVDRLRAAADCVQTTRAAQTSGGFFVPTRRTIPQEES